jgi:hypothetical protein
MATVVADGAAGTAVVVGEVGTAAVAGAAVAGVDADLASHAILIPAAATGGTVDTGADTVEVMAATADKVEQLSINGVEGHTFRLRFLFLANHYSCETAVLHLDSRSRIECGSR